MARRWDGTRPERVQAGEEGVVARVHYRDPAAVALLADRLAGLVRSLSAAGSPQAVVCIGTDRSTGDALGPLVGSHLQRWAPSLRVFGTLEDPVHATNLGETLSRLGALQACFILAVDACLGRAENVGYVTLRWGPLRPGTGVRKNLPEVGHAHIVGVVNVGGFMEYLVLQNTRLGVVWPMARVIARAVARGLAASGLPLPASAAAEAGASRWPDPEL